MLKSTLLIPTYNRSAILKDTVNLIIKSFDFKETEVIILDGSDIVEEQENNEKIVSNTKIKYFFDSKLTMQERVFHGISLASTDIISMLDDEDLIYYNGYSSCVNFLLSNPEYSVAHGKYLNINIINGTMYHSETYLKTNMAQESMYNRLKEFMCPYTTPAFYGVFRKEVLEKCFSYLIKHKVVTRDFITMELLVGIITLINGKSKRLENLYIGRNRSNNSSTSWVSTFEYSKFLLNHYEDVSFERTYEVIKESLIEESERLGLEINLNLIDVLFARWISGAIYMIYNNEDLEYLISSQG